MYRKDSYKIHYPTWDRWVEEGAIIYIDKEEESQIIIDGKKQYGEICKSAIMSSTVAQIPFADRNQAPRNIYQSTFNGYIDDDGGAVGGGVVAQPPPRSAPSPGS